MRVTIAILSDLILARPLVDTKDYVRPGVTHAARRLSILASLPVLGVTNEVAGLATHFIEAGALPCENDSNNTLTDSSHSLRSISQSRVVSHEIERVPRAPSTCRASNPCSKSGRWCSRHQDRSSRCASAERSLLPNRFAIGTHSNRPGTPTRCVYSNCLNRRAEYRRDRGVCG